MQTDTLPTNEHAYTIHMMIAEALMYTAPQHAANAAVFAHQHAIRAGSVEAALAATMLLNVIQSIPVEYAEGVQS